MSGTKSARSSRPWGRRTSEPCRYFLPYLPSQDTRHLSQDHKNCVKIILERGSFIHSLQMRTLMALKSRKVCFIVELLKTY